MISSISWLGSMETNPDPVAPPLPPPNFKPTSFPAAVDSQFDLYTIPSHSCWFSWDSIHETERAELREFFNGSSFTRTPKIYKEYRDFIISKYREEPSRKLTFTEVRKSLVGDVCVLRKVFNFLDKWGLINFGASPVPVGKEDEGGLKVRVEEGAPIGIRVVASPNSSKPLTVEIPVKVAGDGGGGGGSGGVDNGFKLPPLASYSDVFGGSGEEKGVSCGNCKEKCDRKYYECTKEKYVICLKCFEKGTYGENKSVDDFKLNDSSESSGNQGTEWTEAETLLLLESVLKHGDDWELVAQNVHTKSKLECISRLIELPFGELMLGSPDKCSSRGVIDEADAVQEQKASSECQETSKMEDDDHGEFVEKENTERTESLEPPPKRKRIDSSDPSRSLMEQVALISAMVGSQITATAASAAVSVLSDGNPLVRDIFYSEDHSSVEERRSGNLDVELERALQSEDTDMKDASHSSEVDKVSTTRESIPLALRMRAAVATALGAAAAHARLLADQEEREIEHLMAFVVETQLKKLQRKAKFFEDLEHLMEKEHALLDESKDSIIAERMDTLRRVFAAGISRWRDPCSVKPPPAGA